MNTFKSITLGMIVIMILGVAVLFIGGQTQRVDSFKPNEAPPLQFTNVIVLINPPFSDDVVQNTVTLQWYRPEAMRPMVNVFVCDPSYDSVAIHGFSITVNRTNAIELSDAEMSDPEYGLKLRFKPYEDPVGFRNMHPKYSKADPRYAFYMPFPKDPVLTSPPPVGTKLSIRVDFTIMANAQSVCTTNVQADFTLERRETRMSWALMLFLKLFMPRF